MVDQLTKSVGTATDILVAEDAKVRGMMVAEADARTMGREEVLRRF